MASSSSASDISSSSSADPPPTATSSRKRKQLPAELVYEMAKFQHYDGLTVTRQTGRKMAALGKAMLAKKHRRLESLYLDPCSQLIPWSRQWAAHNHRLRAEVSKQAFASLRGFVQVWAAGDVSEQARKQRQMARAKLGQLANSLGGIYEEVAQLQKQIEKITFDPLAETCLARFHLSQDTCRRFKAERKRLLESARLCLFTEICHWGFEDLARWNEMFQRFEGLLWPDFPEEVRHCVQGYNACAERAINCINGLTFFINRTLFR